MKSHRINALFFDLDGTLLDTAPDLALALNNLLAEYEQPPVSIDVVRQCVALGSKAILESGFSPHLQQFDFEKLRNQFLTTYHQRLTENTALYQGMAEVLNYLDQHHIPWGVITNKPYWLAEPLLIHFNLMERSRCLIGGDTLPLRKPDPLPLLHACELIGANPNQCAYVGDAESDIQAAKAAGMLAILAQYGYGSAFHSNTSIDAVIESPLDILQWLMNPKNIND